MRAPQSPTVATALMIQRWRWMTFIHWRYPAEVIQPFLPAGLTLVRAHG